VGLQGNPDEIAFGFHQAGMAENDKCKGSKLKAESSKGVKK
jgi:hypothetical protein